MFRAVVSTLLLATAVGPVRADDVSPALKSGIWYVDEGMIMKTRSEYTFRKDGTFQVEVLNDVPNPKVTGTWKVVEQGGKTKLLLTTKGDRGHFLPDESEARFDKAKNLLVVRFKDGTEAVLKFRKFR